MDTVVVKDGDEKFFSALGYDSESLTAFVSIIKMLQKHMGSMKEVYSYNQLKDCILAITRLQKLFDETRYMLPENLHYVYIDSDLYSKLNALEIGSPK